MRAQSAQASPATAPAIPAQAAFASPSYRVVGGAPAARIVIERVGDSRGEIPFDWWTEGASAKPDVDYAPLGRRTERIPNGAQTVTIYVPIISNPLRQRSTQFYVALGRPHERDQPAEPSARATVTIAPRG